MIMKQSFYFSHFHGFERVLILPKISSFGQQLPILYRSNIDKFKIIYIIYNKFK